MEVIAAIAQRVLADDSPVDWKAMEEHGTIREAIAAVVPGYQELADIGMTKKEFHIPGRTFHKPRFSTHRARPYSTRFLFRP